MKGIAIIILACIGSGGVGFSFVWMIIETIIITGRI